MANTHFHESPDDLSVETREMHRALSSLIEELEAIDWYGQRVEASGDEDLQKILDHNRVEEIEHACMTLEWIRRRDANFDRHLREFLFRDGSVVDAEHADGNGRDTRTKPTLAVGSLRPQRKERA